MNLFTIFQPYEVTNTYLLHQDGEKNAVIPQGSRRTGGARYSAKDMKVSGGRFRRNGKNEVVPRCKFALCVHTDAGAFFMAGTAERRNKLWQSVTSFS